MVMHMKDLDFRVNDLHNVHPFNKIQDLIQTRVDVPGVVANDAETHQGTLPKIIISNLRDRYVVSILYPVDNPAKNLSLAFQRVVPRDTQIDLADSYNHIRYSLPSGYKLGAISSLT